MFSPASTFSFDDKILQTFLLDVESPMPFDSHKAMCTFHAWLEFSQN